MGFSTTRVAPVLRLRVVQKPFSTGINPVAERRRELALDAD